LATKPLLRAKFRGFFLRWGLCHGEVRSEMYERLCLYYPR
jgi:hypothetical protein